MDIFRLIMVEFNPLLKRFFYIQPTIYEVLSTLPLLMLFSGRFEPKRIVLFIFALTILLLHSSIGNITYYFPILILLTFSKGWMETSNYDETFKRFTPFYIVSVAYGLLQWKFGYFGFERAWMQSSLGMVSEINFIFHEDIRPFSFYSGIPEFAIACSLFVLYAFNVRNIILLVLSIIMLVIIGSRGALIGTFVAFFLVFYTPKLSLRVKAILALLLGLGIYVFLAFLYPTYAPQILSALGVDNSSRMSVYGTFNARVLGAEIILSNINDWTFYFFGTHNGAELKLAELAVDNFYLRLINDFGLVLLMIVISIMIYFVRNKNQLYVVSFYFVYGFYSDIFPSLFAMFFLLYVYYSNYEEKRPS